MPDGMQALPFETRPPLAFIPWLHHVLQNFVGLPELRPSFQAYTIELPHNNPTGVP